MSDNDVNLRTLVSHEEPKETVPSSRYSLTSVVNECYFEIMRAPDSTRAQHAIKTYDALLHCKEQPKGTRTLQNCADLLKLISQGMHDIENDPATPVFYKFYAYCFYWLTNQEEKNMSATMGELLLLNKDVEAAKEFIAAKLQSYETGLANGDIPHKVTLIIEMPTKEVLTCYANEYADLLKSYGTYAECTKSMEHYDNVDMSGHKIEHNIGASLLLFGKEQLLKYAPQLQLRTDPTTGQHKLTGGPLCLPYNAGFCIPKEHVKSKSESVAPEAWHYTQISIKVTNLQLS